METSWRDRLSKPFCLRVFPSQTDMSQDCRANDKSDDFGEAHHVNMCVCVRVDMRFDGMCHACCDHAISKKAQIIVNNREQNVHLCECAFNQQNVHVGMNNNWPLRNSFLSLFIANICVNASQDA